MESQQPAAIRGLYPGRGSYGRKVRLRYVKCLRGDGMRTGCALGGHVNASPYLYYRISAILQLYWFFRQERYSSRGDRTLGFFLAEGVKYSEDLRRKP
jgi:hypothetical protein